MPRPVPAPAVQTESATAYGGTGVLFANERRLVNYTADIVGRMAAYRGTAEHVLEFGAGIGTLALEWRRQTHAAPECVELDPEQADLVRQRGFVCRASIGELSRTYDMVYTSNVLEHIEDDRRALAELHSVLREGGVIAIFVPAFMCLYSDADRALGHYRRYQRRELLEKVETAGFAVVDCHFVDSLGFFAWLATRIFGYRAGADLGDDRSLMFYDKWLYPLSRRLDRLGLRHLFGKNILVVARKQGR